MHPFLQGRNTTEYMFKQCLPSINIIKYFVAKQMWVRNVRWVFKSCVNLKLSKLLLCIDDDIIYVMWNVSVYVILGAPFTNMINFKHC